MFVAIRDRVQRAIEVEYERVYRVVFRAVYRGVAGDGRPRVGVRHRVPSVGRSVESSRGIFLILYGLVSYASSIRISTW